MGDVIVVTAGAVARRFAVPDIAEQAIGLKHVEEAVAIRDRLLTAFDRAAALSPGPQRRKLGGGFSGVEGFGELFSLATAPRKPHPELETDELRCHLVERPAGFCRGSRTGRDAAWCARSNTAAPTST
jgi:NADH dehydrogenase